MTSIVNCCDYEDNSFKELLVIIPVLILMVLEIGLLIVRILYTLIWDIVDGVFIALDKIFEEDGELMLMLDYVFPYLYYMKVD